VTPLIFVLQVVALLAAILTSTPWQALLGCAVVLLGLPVYTFLQREHVVPAENVLPDLRKRYRTVISPSHFNFPPTELEFLIKV
jgi:hypothetical protein